jgi:hypothetical protein
MAPAALEPSHKRRSSWLGDLEGDRAAGLLLNDGGTVAKRTAWSDVADLQLYEIAAPELRIDRAVEER